MYPLLVQNIFRELCSFNGLKYFETFLYFYLQMVAWLSEPDMNSREILYKHQTNIRFSVLTSAMILKNFSWRLNYLPGSSANDVEPTWNRRKTGMSVHSIVWLEESSLIMSSTCFQTLRVTVNLRLQSRNNLEVTVILFNDLGVVIIV